MISLPQISDRLTRRHKQLVLVVADLVALPAVLWFVWRGLAGYWWLPVRGGMPLLILLSMVAVAFMLLFGVYRAVVRAFDEHFLHLLLLSIAAYSLAVVVTLTFGVPHSQPFSAALLIAIVTASLMFFWVWGSRTAIRTVLAPHFFGNADKKAVLIYGAGRAGRQLLAALDRSSALKPVAFLDDDRSLMGTVVAGVRVYPGQAAPRIIDKYGVSDVILALPSVSRAVRRRVIQRLEPLGVHVRAIPALDLLAAGDVQLQDLQEIDIADLLGRDPVSPDRSLFERDIKGLVVMVTGAGGSIGSELCRQIIRASPSTLVLFDNSEYALYSIDGELQDRAGCTVIPVLGSVCDQALLERLMREHEVATVYHAAAYKHVPLVETNPLTGLFNNVVGTWRSAQAARAAGVKAFVLVSTDKAVRPTNIMGASKRLAEQCLQALAHDVALKGAAHPRYAMVRFGNVLGSSGSVVPLFRKQIVRGGPITLTHPEVTRFFMTIPEAAQLVIQAGAMAEGGDVFVLDMGHSIKILDLARSMIRLSGLAERTEEEPDGDIEIQYVGLRPGEKLYEELLISNEGSMPTAHSKIFRAFESHPDLDGAERVLGLLMQYCADFERDKARDLLMQHVEGYQPSGRTVPRARPAIVAVPPAGHDLQAATLSVAANARPGDVPGG